MPKQSKVRSTRVTTPAPVEDENGKFICATCGKEYKRRARNFPVSQSPIYKGNQGYITTCKNCVDKLFQQYKESIGSEEEALRRICMKFDIYWNPEAYKMLKKSNTSNSRVSMYIARVNIIRYQGKTFDDTLDDEYNANINPDAYVQSSTENRVDNDNLPVIDEKIKNFWGVGLSDSTYAELNGRYNYWISQYPEGTELDIGSQAILRQICNLEIDINRERAAKKPIDKYVSTLNSLLGSANLKPTQKKEAESVFVPFGVEIANFEKEHPIIEPDPEFQDVDGIKRNITAWFLGHLCKMCGIKNSYVEEYEKEIQEYTLERPSYEEDESDTPDVIFADRGGIVD